MNKHRYSLASNKVKKLDCPYCGAKRHWQRYIDIETGEVLPEQHGRCDNADKCGQQVTPKDTGYAKMIWEQERGNRLEFPNNWKPQRKKAIPQPTPEPVFFHFETFLQTLEQERYEKNTFIQNLFHRVQFPFEVDEVTKVIQLYRLGTVASGYRAGANTFPFIDIKGNVRAVQVKQFDEQNHTTGTDFLHSIIEKHHNRNNKPLPEWLEAYIKQDKRITCLFGEHLLSKYPNTKVYLFEAPKTAIYATLYFGFPEQSNTICLAVYNKSSFSFDKLKVLKGRFVYVFPDLSKDGNTFKEWETKAKEYENRLPGTSFILSDLLEQLAPERDKSEGNDLADYLIKQDWRDFRKQPIQEQPQPQKPTVIQSKVEIGTIERIKRNNVLNITFDDLPFNDVQEQKRESKKIDDWTKEIEDLKIFFNSTSIKTPIHLQQGVTITNITDLVNSHLPIVENYNGKRVGLPYLDRLRKVKDLTINPRLPIDKVSTIFKPQNNYYKADILDKISNEQFNDLIERKIITQTSIGTYYLTSSTPF